MKYHRAGMQTLEVDDTKGQFTILNRPNATGKLPTRAQPRTQIIPNVPPKPLVNAQPKLNPAGGVNPKA